MKKTLALLAVAGMAGAANAAFMQDFEGGIPGDWTVVDHTGSGVVWDIDPIVSARGNLTNGTGNAAMADSDFFGSADYDTSLITHAFVVEAGNFLEYTYNFQAIGTGTNFGDTDISTDGGATWINLAHYDGDHGGFAGPGVDESIDLAAYVGMTAQVRFHYYHTDIGSQWDWWYQVDNVEVTPTPGSIALIGLGGLAMARRRR